MHVCHAFANGRNACAQDMSLDRMVRLENFAVLMYSLQPAKQRQLAAAVVAHASEERTGKIRSAQQMGVLARMVSPLVDADSPAADVVCNPSCSQRARRTNLACVFVRVRQSMRSITACVACDALVSSFRWTFLRRI